MRLVMILSLGICFLAKAQVDEHWRPAFHFTPPAKWMNDPNGLVYHNGKYHLFYQYYPDDIVWGPMHWGHAESTDLLHWKHLPIALFPDSLGWIFSGSAVIDKNNTAGFGKDAMIAIFTYHNDAIWKAGRKNTESQGIAYSLDEGRTWTKYEGNPVLNNSGEQDFRDPKVFWNESLNRWTMTLAVGDRIKIFSSPDLKSWRHDSNFVPPVKEEYGVWECPDLFPMKTGTETKWVMILSQNKNGPNGGSATRYFVGDFDGLKFTPTTQSQWFDYGMDFYAAVTYSNVPDDRRILLGWMSNWEYATKTPTTTWRSAMNLPRELQLNKLESGHTLTQTAIPGLPALATQVFAASSTLVLKKSGLDLSRAIVEFDITAQTPSLVLTLSNASGEKLVVRWKDSQLTVDRSKSGKTDFSNAFAGNLQVMPLNEPPRHIQLILDRSSMEIAVNGGMHWMSLQVFPTKAYDRLETETTGQLTNFNISTVKPTSTR